MSTSTNPRDRALEAIRWARAAITDAEAALSHTALRADDRLRRADELLYALAQDLVTGAER